MDKLNLQEVKQYVNDNISTFHRDKLRIMQELNLNKILKSKNPYLFKAKNLNVASDLVQEILNAYLSSSEEKLFGDFLEDLALFISRKTTNGRKSNATGIDLEFERNNKLYIVSIKSGPNWGNSSQQNKQQADFSNAVRIHRQSKHALNIEPVLGICYGKTRTNHLRGYTKVVGQNFWYFISENKNLYVDIIEPLGYRAKKHNEDFNEEKARIINDFTAKFIEDFCYNGSIDWNKFVEFNSGNFDLDRYIL